jgi:hypothetical protein
MTNMSSDTLLFIYVIALLGAVCLAALYSELRSRHFRPGASQDHVFRCEKCGFVYTDDADVDRSRCSQCGSLNEAIEF